MRRIVAATICWLLPKKTCDYRLTMTITFLGTGTSQGVPLIGCTCDVCTSPDRNDKRLRSSVWVDAPEGSVVNDTGPDFRYQMLRAGVRKLDAVVFTHGHKDHTAGLDDVRAYNYIQNRAMDVHASEETWHVLRREFAYIFENSGYPGIPQLQVHTFGNKRFLAGGLSFLPIRTLHHKLEVFGFRIGDFTYITDANFIAPAELDKARGSRVLVLNALRHQQHISHFTLDEAIAVAKEIGAEKTYFTHISHQLGRHLDVSRMLPAGIHLAYDNLQLSF
jgi:phosphoribosyl 1,2-cyclic phosphate phosphodiesterase